MVSLASVVALSVLDAVVVVLGGDFGSVGGCCGGGACVGCGRTDDGADGGAVADADADDLLWVPSRCAFRSRCSQRLSA